MVPDVPWSFGVLELSAAMKAGVFLKQRLPAAKVGCIFMSIFG